MVAMIAAVAMVAPTPASAASIKPTGGAALAPSGGKPAAGSSRTVTISLTPKAGGVASPDLYGSGIGLCTLTATETYLGSGDNQATGYVFCSAIEDGIFFNFYWYKHGTASILHSSGSIPDHETNSSFDIGDFHSYALLDVYVCVTVARGSQVLTDCAPFYNV
jgi:hypothetical protein